MSSPAPDPSLAGTWTSSQAMEQMNGRDQGMGKPHLSVQREKGAGGSSGSARPQSMTMEQHGMAGAARYHQMGAAFPADSDITG